MINNTNTKAMSFWEFLNDNTIEIPIIQRDYAHGRLGKETLRKNFLADLKKALDNESPYKDTSMKLDFVYGSKENGRLNPLDGQQRLTTLWLLHWYIALRAGQLNEDNCSIFRKFTYETRISSREFCENLCVPVHFLNYNRKDIVGFITKQTWFYSAWKQDPTIQSMLRMLGGTKVADKKGEDIIDGIEELFQNTNEDVFKNYWKLLTEKDAIVFYHLPLSDFGLSDDLYIKMNARGKQLTSFENFKADLIGYITKQTEDEELDKHDREEWKKLLDPITGIPIKIDTDWTDIFWRNKSIDNRIDDIFFAFINRFFLQELICAKNEDNTEFLYFANDIEKSNETFTHLYGKSSDDSNLQYNGFGKYKYYECQECKEIPISFFTRLCETLTNFKIEEPEVLKCFPDWVDSKIFEFIPKYDDKGQISTLGQKERVVFLAICRYLENGRFESRSFKQWMRVVWNITENSGVETILAMIGAMRLIDELSCHSHCIYRYLSDSNSHIESNFAKDQIAEEIAKAGIILNDDCKSCEKFGKNKNKTWEETIINAEKYAFFKGAIRFLFTNGEGKINWCDFDTKWENVQTHFLENGEPHNPYSGLLKTLISNFNKWDDFKAIFYNNKLTHWRNNLLNTNLQYPVHLLLMTKTMVDSCSYQSCISDKPLEYLQNQLVKTNFLEKIPAEDYYMEEGRNLHIYYRNRDSDIYLVSPHKNELLSNCHIECTRKITTDSNFYYGKNIKFKYDKYFFQWWGNPNQRELDIYLMEADWKYFKKRANPTNDKGTDEDEYYCFRVDDKTTSEAFIESLKKLIKEASDNSPE